MLPDFERADAIGSYWGNPKMHTFAELLIDCEEDRTLRAGSSGCCEGRPLRNPLDRPVERDAGRKVCLSTRFSGCFWSYPGHKSGLFFISRDGACPR